MMSQFSYVVIMVMFRTISIPIVSMVGGSVIFAMTSPKLHSGRMLTSPVMDVSQNRSIVEARTSSSQYRCIHQAIELKNGKLDARHSARLWAASSAVVCPPGLTVVEQDNVKEAKDRRQP